MSPELTDSSPNAKGTIWGGTRSHWKKKLGKECKELQQTTKMFTVYSQIRRETRIARFVRSDASVFSCVVSLNIVNGQLTDSFFRLHYVDAFDIIN
jgi:hypothetical protein